MVCGQDLDTDEGYDYVMARCRKLLSLSSKDFEDRCINLALPMYEKALGALSSRLDTVQADSLVKARLTLGLDLDAKVIPLDSFPRYTLAFPPDPFDLTTHLVYATHVCVCMYV